VLKMDEVIIKIYLSFPPLYSSENGSLTYQVLEYNESSPESACIYGEGSKNSLYAIENV